MHFIDSGDVNVNQNLAVALFQNLFLRFHNYVADRLQNDHPAWTDETVYQETRRIVAAVIQIITYDHFLPIILGNQDGSRNIIKIMDDLHILICIDFRQTIRGRIRIE